MALAAAHRAVAVKLWKIPALSPDLNPVERFWGWLRKQLLAMDLKDAVNKRQCLAKTASVARVRGVVKTKKAQAVAKSYAASFRATCKIVVEKKGAHSGK